MIKQPKFTVEGWAKVEDVKAGRKTTAKPAKVDMAAELDDELPDWGNTPAA